MSEPHCRHTGQRNDRFFDGFHGFPILFFRRLPYRRGLRPAHGRSALLRRLILPLRLALTAGRPAAGGKVIALAILLKAVVAALRVAVDREIMPLPAGIPAEFIVIAAVAVLLPLGRCVRMFLPLSLFVQSAHLRVLKLKIADTWIYCIIASPESQGTRGAARRSFPKSGCIVTQMPFLPRHFLLRNGSASAIICGVSLRWKAGGSPCPSFSFRPSSRSAAPSS